MSGAFSTPRTSSRERQRHQRAKTGLTLAPADRANEERAKGRGGRRPGANGHPPTLEVTETNKDTEEQEVESAAAHGPGPQREESPGGK